MKTNKVILVLSFPLGVLMIFASCIGLFTPEFYHAETINWQAQSIGQDMIDLVLAPVLLFSAALASRKNRIAESIWGGVVLYLTYTYTLYCFDVHFNKLFLIYCLCLGLSFYSFLYFLFFQFHERRSEYSISISVRRFIGIYFMVIAVLFYILWLSEIVPAIVNRTTPASIIEAGLFTNGVQVIDISVVLPAIFIVGMLLLRKRRLGFILTPVILTFLILMDITIGVLVVVMNARGVESDLILSGIMGMFTLISLLLLILYFKRYIHTPETEH